MSFVSNVKWIITAGVIAMGGGSALAAPGNDLRPAPVASHQHDNDGRRGNDGRFDGDRNGPRWGFDQKLYKAGALKIEKGERSVREGKQLIERGQRLHSRTMIRKGERLVAQGKQFISAGWKLQQRAWKA